MAALSDYLESGLLNHVFRGGTFAKPGNVSLALTSGIPQDSNTGATIPEIPSGINGSGTGYARIDLGAPADDQWTHTDERGSSLWSGWSSFSRSVPETGCRFPPTRHGSGRRPAGHPAPRWTHSPATDTVAAPPPMRPRRRRHR